MNHNKLALFTLTIIAISVLFSAWLLSSIPQKTTLDHASGLKYGLGYNVYATITFTQNGKLVYYYSGLDPLTNLGLNLTFAKLTGSSTYNLTTYNMNTTYVSLGNYTSAMNGATTALTGEFVRVSGTIHAQVYNGYNITGTFSGLAGTNSSNCMGVNYASSTIGQNDLFGYTTFNLVTGIDSTFVITAEIQVQGTTT